MKAAERYLVLAEQGSTSVPGARRGRVQVQVLLGMVRLLLAHQDGNFAAVPAHARQLLANADAADVSTPRLGDDLRALTLISLGDVEAWTARPMRPTRICKRRARWHAALDGPISNSRP